jgi:protein subunit release factor B
MADTKNKLFSVTIKDCKVDTFRCPGKGGQNVNKVSSGVRITHEPSGAVATSCLTRDQFRNKRDAFVKMAESVAFKAWVRKQAAELQTGKTIDQQVDELMVPENLRVESRTATGRWLLWED